MKYEIPMEQQILKWLGCQKGVIGMQGMNGWHASDTYKTKQHFWWDQNRVVQSCCLQIQSESGGIDKEKSEWERKRGKGEREKLILTLPWLKTKQQSTIRIGSETERENRKECVCVSEGKKSARQRVAGGRYWYSRHHDRRTKQQLTWLLSAYKTEWTRQGSESVRERGRVSGRASQWENNAVLHRRTKIFRCASLNFVVDVEHWLKTKQQSAMAVICLHDRGNEEK